MEKNQKRALLVVILNLFNVLIIYALVNSGAGGLIVGAYTIMMFIVLSTLVIKMITQPNGKKVIKEQHL
ncbi:hypothetical protein H9649_13190 [Sporosarcina sp. Sa2YVA2]|uniref:Uncharacterized protein n=1 Tax=Sporosarcina quadrami TaxID=2762234 RepID=A0ABR8UCJ1_9BACL|nr:hypothetical protein [Sporosarcina quadrami]MBD7985545.1 hypothetical protein [Sporosarcina quadrami]